MRFHDWMKLINEIAGKKNSKCHFLENVLQTFFGIYFGNIFDAFDKCGPYNHSVKKENILLKWKKNYSFTQVRICLFRWS
jgi:spore coat polysaccharide biosynthesis predicted glycosyltransferase SpsG